MGPSFLTPPVSKVTRITRRNFDLPPPSRVPRLPVEHFWGRTPHASLAKVFKTPELEEKTQVKNIYIRERKLSLASRRRGAVAELSRRRRKLSEVLAALSAHEAAQW